MHRLSAQDYFSDPAQTYHKMSVTALAAAYGAFPWEDYFQRLFARVGGRHVGDVIVYVPDYLAGLNTLLQNTSFETIRVSDRLLTTRQKHFFRTCGELHYL